MNRHIMRALGAAVAGGALITSGFAATGAAGTARTGPANRGASFSSGVLAFPPAALSAAGAAPAGSRTAASCPWLDQGLPVAQRVSGLISAMTLDQKIAEMHVFSMTATGPYAGYEGYVPAQPTLCIPALIEQDDSQGVATKATGVTQLPAAVALSSAWSPSLARQYGTLNGAEHWGKGISMALGPGVNIQRDPRWGRNFENLSEDPYLSSRLIVPDTEGVQSQHVLADVKHFAVYNQETYRNTPADDVVVSDRVLHEIYLPAFQAATMQAGAASVMCSFSSLGGTFNCQNPYLLSGVLGTEWGYQGFVRTDGGASHSTVASVNAGLDQEKGSDYWDNGRLAAAVADGQVSMATINDAVRRIVTPMFSLGLFNNPPTGKLSDVVTTAGHAAFARKVAERGTVLLKNASQALPLRGISSVAVIGPDGGSGAYTGGGGSSHVIPPYVVTPCQGIKARAGSGVKVTCSQGAPGTGSPRAAAAAAAQAHAAIVFVNNTETENRDLTSIGLPAGQDQLIQAVAAANPDTIVVLNTGGPVTMPWLSRVRSVVEAWYPGQEDGNAIAAVLFGDVNPSGHLPETFPKSLSQVPASTPARWPGVNGQVHYSEGLDVGYRWYDAKGITPLFPFGYGLSYTKFSFSHLYVSPSSTTSLGTIRVSITVTNTGSRTGAEVAQLYLADPAAAGEPPRQLKGFHRVTLGPGKSARVHFTLTPSDLSYWNSRAGTWAVADGTYRVLAGDSSAIAGLPLSGSFKVNGTTGARNATIRAPAHAQAGSPFTVTTALTPGGDLSLSAVRLRLGTPPGWQAQPLGPATAATLGPSQGLTVSWRVTAPAGAQDSVNRLTAAATFQAPKGGPAGNLTAGALVTVDPPPATAATP